MNDQNLIDLFLEMILTERAASLNTIESYRRDLEQFIESMSTKSENILISSRAEDLRKYLAQIEKKGFAASTTARKISCLRQFYKFIYGEGIRADNPALDLESPQKGRSLPKLLSEQQVTDLISYAKKRALETGNFNDMRLWALLELLYATDLGFLNWSPCPHPFSEAASPIFMCGERGKRNEWFP